MSNNFLEELTTLVRKHADPGNLESVYEIVAGLEIAKASVLSRLIEMAQNDSSLGGDGASTRPEGQKVSG